MNAEALVGAVLGTCTLQQLIGQGSIGAVFLAQQAGDGSVDVGTRFIASLGGESARQVAVKVLTNLPPHQLAPLLDQFRREINEAASLEHQNIVSVYEYGDRADVAYLVMPYISGGTLRDVLDREGTLALPKALNYLEQLAVGLDFAHARGIVHQGIKPSNILLTPEERLLLTDFGIGKLSLGQQEGQLTKMAAIEYRAPEQLLGEPVDGRADLYSLGVLLYQMVTGTTPFQGATAMRVAVQHIHSAPRPPHTLRIDLPLVVEQVILRALAKRPAERYASGQELVAALRLALVTSGVQLSHPQAAASAPSGLPSRDPIYRVRQFRPGGLFDPALQAMETASSSGEVNTSGWQPQGMSGQGLLSQRPAPVGALQEPGQKVPGQGLLSSVSEPGPKATGEGLLSRGLTGREAGEPTLTGIMPLPTMSGLIGQAEVPLREVVSESNPVPAPNTSGRIAVPTNGQETLASTTGDIRTMRLTESVKVVRMPVVGQPGLYVTGLLPTLPEPQPAPVAKSGLRKYIRIVILAVAVLVLVFSGSAAFWFIHTHPGQVAKLQPTSIPARVVVTPNVQATAMAQATATVNANVILLDPLNQNIHNWFVSTSGSKLYVFKNGAYHITNNDPKQVAPAILPSVPNQILSQPFGYTLTIQEIKGNDASINNAFGMIIRFNQQNKNGKAVTTFYSFEVANTKEGEYQFWRYDDSKGATASPWTKVWHQVFGREFHPGQSVNTFKIFANGSNFTFMVNGKNVGHTGDSSISSGKVGMLVNLQGTEVAFSNLELTYN